jgi:hypothetical protein
VVSFSSWLDTCVLDLERVGVLKNIFPGDLRQPSSSICILNLFLNSVMAKGSRPDPHVTKNSILTPLLQQPGSEICNLFKCIPTQYISLQTPIQHQYHTYQSRFTTIHDTNIIHRRITLKCRFAIVTHTHTPHTMHECMRAWANSIYYCRNISFRMYL